MLAVVQALHPSVGHVGGRQALFSGFMIMDWRVTCYLQDEVTVASQTAPVVLDCLSLNHLSDSDFCHVYPESLVRHSQLYSRLSIDI